MFAGPGLYFSRNIYVYSFRVLSHKNGIITCANHHDNEQYVHLISLLFESDFIAGSRSASVGHFTEEPEMPGSTAGPLTYFRG